MRKPSFTIVPSARRGRRAGSKEDSSEAGYLLIAVLFLAAIILLALALAAPQVAVGLQRDKEGELVHRGMQYAGGIRRYYRRFGAYPNNLDQLEKSNNLRFLRKRYKDPIAGKDEWKLIRLGQAKTTGSGLFGQAAPSTDSGIAGAAGGGAGSSSSANPGGGLGGGSSLNGAGGSFGNSGSSFGNSGSSFGNSGSSFGNSGSSFGSSGSSFGGSSQGGGQGGSPGSGGSFGSSGSSGSSNGIGGTTGGGTFGGGQIIGVSSTSAKQSIREFKKQTHYNQWEFVYDPNVDGRVQGSTGTGVSTTPGTTQPNSGVFGGSSGGSFGPGSSGGGSFGPQPTSPTSPTTPPTP